MATKGIGRPLTILLQADTTGFGKGLQEAETKMERLGKSVNKAAAVAGVALAGLGAAALDFAKAAAEDQKSATLLEKSLKDLTGATDAQVQAVEEYVTATSLAVGVADDELRPAMSRLLRSTGDVAKSQELLNLALDISATTGQGLDVVVKALAKGYDGSTTALGKLGLGIDRATLASGDFAAIQAIIQEKVGGTAQTVAGTAEGSFARLTVSINEAKESIGAGLLPSVVLLTDQLTKLVPSIQRNADNIVKISGAVAVLSAAIVALKFAITAVTVTLKVFSVVAAATKIITLTLAAATGSASAAQTLAELTYKRSTVALVAYKVAMLAQAAATKIATIATLALNVALRLNPIGIVVTAIVALVAILVLAYKNSETFRKGVDWLFEAFKKVGTYIKNFVIGYFEFLFKVITKVKDAIVGIGKAIKDSPVGQAIASVFDSDIFRAAGGPVKQGKSYVVGEQGPELFTATSSGNISSAGSFGVGGGGVNITINGAIDPEGVRRSLENLFQNSARRTGPINFAGARL
jgi:hypothetical protein